MDHEAELVRRAKEGDKSAFEALVTMYEKKVYSLAFRYTGNQEDALDISQEVFLRVFRFLSGFNEQSAFSTWLFRITSNVCRDHLKKRRSLMELPLEVQGDDDQLQVEIADSRSGPEQELERIETREAIGRGLASLSDEHRQILVMREVSGFSYSEISDILGLELGTVKSRIARARDSLRLFLNDLGNNTHQRKSNKTERGGVS